MQNIVEIDGNWKRFLEADEEDILILLHATSVENAQSIMKEGFQIKEANWKDSEKGYVYLAGSEYGLGTYRHFLRNAIMKVAVPKKHLLPDDNSGDWKDFISQPNSKVILRSEKVNLSHLTAFDTFKHIGQVKAKLEHVKPFKWKEMK